MIIDFDITAKRCKKIEVLSSTKMGLIMMVMFMMLGNMAKANEHFVGGSKISWAPNVNMTEWASHEHFYLDDWLYFGYDKHMYNVLEVNKTSYENCKETDFIKNITGVGRDVFQLTEKRTYYFLSGGGFCWGGMKVAIDVTEYVAPAPQPIPPKGGSDSYASGFHVYHTLVLLIIVFMWIIPFN